MVRHQQGISHLLFCGAPGTTTTTTTTTTNTTTGTHQPRPRRHHDDDDRHDDAVDHDRYDDAGDDDWHDHAGDHDRYDDAVDHDRYDDAGRPRPVRRRRRPLPGRRRPGRRRPARRRPARPRSRPRASTPAVSWLPRRLRTSRHRQRTLFRPTGGPPTAGGSLSSRSLVSSQPSCSWHQPPRRRLAAARCDSRTGFLTCESLRSGPCRDAAPTQRPRLGARNPRRSRGSGPPAAGLTASSGRA